MQSFFEGMRFRRETVKWDLEKRRAWMLKRLTFVVRRAYVGTTYYRELFDSIGFNPNAEFTFEDFGRLPILSRDEIRNAGQKLLSKPGDKEVVLQATGGSDGVPTEVWLGPEELGWGESGQENFRYRIGVPTGSRTALLWGHHLDPQASDSFRDRYHGFEQNQRWFDCLRMSPEVLEKYHEELTRWRPACVIAYASALAELAEHVLQQGYRPNYPTHCFITGAEKLWPQHRELIQKAFGRPTHERYGARDAGGIAFQFEPWRTLDYETDWTNTFVEPETDDLEAPILVTKLHADAMPIIRYRLGDVGRFPELSKTGHPTFILHEIIGRIADRIWLPNGQWITGLQIPHMMKDYPVKEFVFFQRADYSIEIRIVPKNGFAEEHRNSILKTVAANLPGVNISIEIVRHIERAAANKWRPVMSEIKSQ
jgi:phenylacetate-CoA ligase